MKQLRYLALIGALTTLTARAEGLEDTIWIEGENTVSANLPPKISGWGNKELLSEEKWLHYSIDADKVDAEVPEEGILLQYAFDVAKAASHEIWGRIGFENVRAPFDWRVDGGEWQRVASDVLTLDLMPIDFFCEVAWYRFGELTLAAGSHTLDLRLVSVKDAKGKTGRLIFAVDAFCISTTPFLPNGRHKPGEEWRTDKDLAAAQQVFVLPEPESPEARSSVKLAGVWEICRNDELLPPADIAQPMKDFPAQPFWTAIDVPGDRNTLRPDLLLAHRLWYRTKIEVPASQIGRSFFLSFPQNNLNTTVFVNGNYCGFFKHPVAAFDIDVTAAIKPGVNDVWVGIRDAWYGYSTNPTNPLKLRSKFKLPVSVVTRNFQDLAYPIWNHPQSGILQTPTFTAAGGPVYASDVFVKPSVSRKTLGVEITLANTSASVASGEVRWSAIHARDESDMKTFPAQTFELAAGETRMLDLADPWDNPRLWWPDEPNLYLLRCDVVVGGRVVDRSDTRFGFREWGWEGRDFTLNGIVWHGWADCFRQSTPQDWLDFYRAKNQTMMRFWGTTWMGMAPRDALDFFDENGVVCRRSGTLDGERHGYNVVENDPDLKTESPIKMDLMRNWLEQMVAQVKGERNHPSVMIWSLENEFLYINSYNLYRKHLDEIEAQVTRTSEAVRQADPTRPTMVDGGGATRAQTLPVHGDHYVASSPMKYPDLAYEANTTAGGRDWWIWDEQRPRFLGEDFFMAGNHPEVAYFEGDSAFAGKPVKGVAIWNRMLQEGYRWAGYGAWHYWVGQTDTDQSQYIAYAARAVFSRDWNWTFAAGTKVPRTFAIFNDTRHADPITFAWELTVGGKKVADASKTHKVAPGTKLVLEESLPMPNFKAGRQEGELTLVLTVGGKEVFRDVKAVSVLAPEARKLPGIGAKDLIVFDPQGSTAAFLAQQRIPFTRIASLDELPDDGRVLVVGKDALDAAASASSRLAAYAAGDRRLVVLEQTHPLRYQGLPAEMAPAENQGFTAFREDAGHPALQGLLDKDFFTWGSGVPVYRNAYEKPARGARSLVQCDALLRHTALVEVPVAKGLMLLCQLSVAENLETNPVARQLLFNLLGAAATHRQEFHPATALLDADSQLKVALDATGLKYNEAADVLEALVTDAPSIAVVAATPARLKRLADNLARVEAFTAAGGALILCGVTPDGLADFNRIVGFDHMMRPSRRERVTLPPVRDRLTAGLTAGDVVLESSKKIFTWQAGCYLVDDMFTHVVDYDEVAPFGTSTFASYDNIVNGFVRADGWPLIINFPKNEDDSPYDIPIMLPKPQEITEFTWLGNSTYWLTTKLKLFFDDDRANPLEWDVSPANQNGVFAIDPPRTATKLTLQLAEWMPVANKAPNLGIDNIYIRAARPEAFRETVKPMLNIGGLMHYTKGQGSIVLCNLNFKAQEEVPVNVAKKRAILSTILRNLKAPFSEGRTVVAGMNLTYRPVNIENACNQYRDEKGWFGDKRFNFKDLPTGEQRLAGVKYDIYEMPTSPVPNAILLGGKNVPGQLAAEVRGIAVGSKADALFFLHTARIDRRRRPNEIKDGKTFELARYAVNYADGETVEIPVLAEIDVEHYHQKEPAVIPGAQLAWILPYKDTDQQAVAYSKQWRNPRPDVVIQTIDILPGKDNAGVPAVLAITAAQGE